MPRQRNPNLAILELAVERLGPLVDELVFLGGCATGLLLTDAAAPPIRATQDVDVITGVASLPAYHRLSAQLRKRGFREDQSPEAPICRWTAPGVLLDVMPAKPEILGFGNPWYQAALETATPKTLPSGKIIRMVTAPYFLATKLAAFDGRGRNDYAMSHDMEDVVAVLDGREEVITDIAQTDPVLRAHLAARFLELLRDNRFVDALSGHLPGDEGSQARMPLLMQRIQEIAEIE